MAIDPDDLPVCDGHVNREKLAHLMGIGTERPALDYKATVDLGVTKELVEFARDVAAMSSNPKGGYIVYGLDKNGQPATTVTPIDSTKFDEADLRSQLRKYLGSTVDLTSATHDLDGHPIAVVYVRRARYGMTPMEMDGDYQDEQGKPAKRFRAGDIFVKNGTQVNKAKATDIPRLLAEDIEDAKDQGRQEMARVFAETQSGVTGSVIAQGPIGAINWRLPAEDFDGAVLQALRSGDRIALRAAFLPLPGEAMQLLTAPDRLPDLHTMLNRITSAVALGLSYDDQWLTRQALQALQKIYALGGDQRGEPRTDLVVSGHQLWLAVGTRVEALGALAIRLEQWDAARDLALTPGAGTFYRSWLRQALTEGARSGLLPRRDGHMVPGAFAGAARELVAEVAALRPDAPENMLPDYSVGAAPSDVDPILDSILQFDVAWCLAVVLAKPGLGTSQFYTSFATFFEHRTAPFIDRVLTDPVVRSAVLGDQGDAALATGLADVLSAAERESNQNGHFGGFRTSTAEQFLADHLPADYQNRG